MNYKSFVLFLMAVSSSLFGQAQTTPTEVKEDFSSSTLNQPGQRVPESQFTRLCPFPHRGTTSSKC